jgi:ribosomal-protein-alanine N-acetyltransferase
VFQQAAALVLEFAFELVGVHRLEARCALSNGRGGRALAKMGAAAEGILRQGLVTGDREYDQVLYTIVDREWRQCRDRARAVCVSLVH